MDEAQMAAELADELSPEPELFEEPIDPGDQDAANQWLYRLRRLAIERSKAQAVARAERDRVDAWERDRVGSYDRRMEEATRMLEQWTRAHHERTGSVTVKLPNGELRLRPGRPRLEVTDDTAVTDYALERVYAAIDKDLREGTDNLPTSGSTLFRLAWRHLTAEPLLKVTAEPAKAVIKKESEPGPVASEHEDLDLRRALIGGEVVPGVLFQTDKRKAFGMTLATGEPDGPEPASEEDEDVNRG